ncbi:MAG: gluconate 2-dehydrogenase subunit 3 family protein [Gemmatimonadetes bacterium]|nr:gluconate 2-dehydrogenase subunit 3 family protein [Gemmatimonadota bacterium]
MSDGYVSRRAFMAAAAGAGGAFLVAGWPEAAAAAERARDRAEHAGKARYKVLTTAEADDIIALTSTIMPSDGTPGAKEAGVVFFVDQSLATTSKDMRKPLQAMLADVNAQVAKAWPGQSHASGLSDQMRIELMTWIEKEKPQHFGMLKGLTLAGMFAMPSRGGNRDKAGWKLIGFKDQFSWKAPYGWYDGEGAK